MKTLFIQLVSLTMVVLISGCTGSDVDVAPPTMSVVSFDPSPEADDICGTVEPTVFHLIGGNQLVFDVLFEDDEALSQYKVDIHNNFDCHGHGGGSAPSVVIPNVANQTTDWTVLDIQNVSGTSASIKRSLEVPTNVTAGNYHFQIQVVDESGNDNPGANFFALKINNPLDSTAPQIDVTEPMDRSFTIKKGEVFTISGQVTDDRSLSDGGNGVVYLAYTDLGSGNTFSTDEYFVFDNTVDKSFDFEITYTIPRTWTMGNYRLSLGANDGVRNVASFEFFDLEVRD